jgi:MOSC domain-containing protein YiiM
MWHRRGTPNPDAQLTLMNVRAAEAIAGSAEQRPLAGDQLYVDLDLSIDNLPAGTQLAVGDAVVEVTPEPHTGCAKFSARFGTEALKFVNKSPGRELRLRGVNARVVTPGTVRAGDTISKL